jgi:hypothetical protein
MARRTRRKSRKSKSSRRRRRQSGGSGVAQHAGDFGAVEPAAQAGGEGEEPTTDQKGGKRKRKGKSKKKKTRKKKRGLNAYFKLMLNAKKKGLSSFKYKGATYKGKKHHRLGMIYKKSR